MQGRQPSPTNQQAQQTLVIDLQPLDPTALMDIELERRARNTHPMKAIFSLLLKPRVDWLVASEAFL